MPSLTSPPTLEPSREPTAAQPYPQMAVELYRDDPTGQFLAHESGHVATARGLLNNLYETLDAARAQWRPRTAQDQHYARNEYEYYAETWARALRALRESWPEKKVAKADRDMPGVQAVWSYMRTLPPFNSGGVLQASNQPKDTQGGQK